MRTYTANPKTVERQWHVIDANGQVLGRVATEAARLLQGKHKPIYTPFLDTGDHVVIVNAGRVKLTGRKEEQKIYRRHSGYEGGLREERAKDVRGAQPDPAGRRSGARHAAQDEARRRDVPQAEGVCGTGSPARGAETHQARGCVTWQSIQYYGTGRRKTSTARVFLRPGTGAITVNHREFDDFFPTDVAAHRDPAAAAAHRNRRQVRHPGDGGRRRRSRARPAPCAWASRARSCEYNLELRPRAEEGRPADARRAGQGTQEVRAWPARASASSSASGNSVGVSHREDA